MTTTNTEPGQLAENIYWFKFTGRAGQVEERMYATATERLNAVRLEYGVRLDECPTETGDITVLKDRYQWATITDAEFAQPIKALGISTADIKPVKLWHPADVDPFAQFVQDDDSDTGFADVDNAALKAQAADQTHTIGCHGDPHDGDCLDQTATDGDEPYDDAPAAPSSYSLAAIHALSGSRRHVYGGTVPFATRQDRRRKNRAARASRSINRRTR